MTTREINYLENLKTQYTPKQASEMDSLRKLDKKVRRPAIIFAYILGIVASLILGSGMCLAMGVIPQIGTNMVVGIPVGLVGIALCGLNYLLYNKILASRKKRYSQEIITLTDVLLNK